MMITDFTRDHVPQAEALARTCYEEERGHTPALPPVDALPPLDRFAQYGFGAAAFDGETLLGFLCFYPPIARAFTTRVRGTFSPIHAHGAVADRRADIYARLYAYAACKLGGRASPRTRSRSTRTTRRQRTRFLPTASGCGVSTPCDR